MRLIVGITGATGAIYGIRLLQFLKDIRDAGAEIHLVLTEWARVTIPGETPFTVEEVEALATRAYDIHDLMAPIASGSSHTDAMVVIPCSMKTLASIANGLSDNLLTRAADVMIKERRPLILVPRETPLSAIHLGNMLKLAQLGVTILPPMPAFYNRPQSLDDVINHTIAKVLDQLGLEHKLASPWLGRFGVPPTKWRPS